MKPIKELQDIRTHFEKQADDLFTKICRTILDNVDRDNYEPVMDTIMEYGSARQRAGEAHGVIGERVGVDYFHDLTTGEENDSKN